MVPHFVKSKKTEFNLKSGSRMGKKRLDYQRAGKKGLDYQMAGKKGLNYQRAGKKGLDYPGCCSYRC